MNVLQTVTKIITTETAHRLHKYQGNCANVHGHSYRWEVTATRLADAPIDGDKGILVDFGLLKQAMQREIHEQFDHVLVLFQEDPLAVVIEEGGNYGNRLDERMVAVPWNPTAENLARHAAQRVQYRLDEFHKAFLVDYRPLVTRVRVWETATCFAEYDALAAKQFEQDLLGVSSVVR